MLNESAFDRGVRLLAAGQSEAALEQFKFSLAAAEAEQRADSLYNIAICYVRLGRTDEAVQSISEAVAADPNIIADIVGDEDFAPLREEAGFEQLLHRSHGGASLGVSELAAASPRGHQGAATALPAARPERREPAPGSSFHQSELTPTPKVSASYASSFGKYGGYAGFAAMFAFPRAGCIFAAVIGAVCGGGGAALGAAVGSFFDSVGEEPPTSGELPDSRGIAVASLLLGITGLVAWFIPLAGLPVTITGFVLGRKARLSSQRGIALTGMGLSLLGLLLSAGNGYWGALFTVRAGIELRR